MMIFINTVYKEDVFPKKYAEGFLQLLNPVAPHITEELWHEVLNKKESITYSKWPTYDEDKTIENTFELPIQINGKRKAGIEVPINSEQEQIKEAVHKAVTQWIKDKTIIKEIYVKNKIYNIVVK